MTRASCLAGSTVLHLSNQAGTAGFIALQSKTLRVHIPFARALDYGKKTTTVMVTVTGYLFCTTHRTHRTHHPRCHLSEPHQCCARCNQEIVTVTVTVVLSNKEKSGWPVPNYWDPQRIERIDTSYLINLSIWAQTSAWAQTDQIDTAVQCMTNFVLGKSHLRDT